MYERAKNYTHNKPRVRKCIGWFFVIVGFAALITPLTPGGILFFIGLELLGIRFIGVEKVKQLWLSRKTASEIVSTKEKIARP